MAISFVADNTGSTAAYGTSYAITKPTNTDGDLIVAILGGKGASPSGSGWTLLMQSSVRSGGSMDQTSVYYKFASGEGSGSYTVSLSAAQVACGWIGAYRGVDATTPIDTTNKTVVSAGATTNFTPSAITATSGQWGIVFGIGYAGGTNTPGTYTESGSPTVTFERADFGVAGGSPDNTSMVVAEYQSVSSGSFAPTITRSPTSAAGDKGALLLNNGSFNGTGNAEAPGVTAAAYDATTAQGVAALAQVANLTLTAYGIKQGVQAAISSTFKAWDASVKIGACAEASNLALNAGDKGVNYGAPPGRTVKVGAENRTYKPTSELRTYVVEVGAID